MAADFKSQITFYDIAPAPPLVPFAPNPWKARYALNLKGLPYVTAWTDMPDIGAARAKLELSANRTHADGTPYPTLPAMHDGSTGRSVGDTFEIALYLDRTYPAPRFPALFHPRTHGLTAAFNAQVDRLFTLHVALCDRMPFAGHEREAEIMAMFAKRHGVARLEDMRPGEADREKMFVSFERALGELLKAYRHTGGTTDWFFRPEGTGEGERQNEGRDAVGPYLDGEGPVYADLIVGGWLAMFEASLGKGDWERVRGWHDGFWGRLHDALEPLREVK